MVGIPLKLESQEYKELWRIYVKNEAKMVEKFNAHEIHLK